MLGLNNWGVIMNGDDTSKSLYKSEKEQKLLGVKILEVEIRFYFAYKVQSLSSRDTKLK